MSRSRIVGAIALITLVAITLVVSRARSWFLPGGSDWIQGIDVSHHQGPIDWGAVGSDGVRFAWIKATEGGDWRDPRFAGNWRAAAEAGVPRGAYHFFTLCRPAAEQAAWFLSVAPAGELPAAVDLEFDGNCAARPDPATLAADLGLFLDTVERARGRRPVVYVTGEVFREHADALRGETLWVRSIFHPVRWGVWAPARVWQYSAMGRVEGIQGDVDRNAIRRGAWPLD